MKGFVGAKPIPSVSRYKQVKYQTDEHSNDGKGGGPEKHPLLLLLNIYIQSLYGNQESKGFTGRLQPTM